MILTANEKLNGHFGASLGIGIFTVAFGKVPVLVHRCLERNPLALEKRTIVITADTATRRKKMIAITAAATTTNSTYNNKHRNKKI